MTIDIARYRRDFPSLGFESPVAAILEIVIVNEGRQNAATESMHRDLAMVWRVSDELLYTRRVADATFAAALGVLGEQRLSSAVKIGRASCRERV